MTGKRVVLRDGSEVLIRQVRPADVPLLAAGFARLSAESRRLRFLTAKTELTPAELRYFTEVDHHDHEALGALSVADGRGLGIARYIRDTEDPEVAEIAITVIDEWQRRGLGTELLRQLLERARQEGVLRFTALVATDNAAMLGLLDSLGLPLRVKHREVGAVEYEITPDPGRSGTDLRGLLRVFGRRQVVPPASIREALSELVPDRFTDEDT